MRREWDGRVGKVASRWWAHSTTALIEAGRHPPQQATEIGELAQDGLGLGDPTDHSGHRQLRQVRGGDMDPEQGGAPPRQGDGTGEVALFPLGRQGAGHLLHGRQRRTEVRSVDHRADLRDQEMQQGQGVEVGAGGQHLHGDLGQGLVQQPNGAPLVVPGHGQRGLGDPQEVGSMTAPDVADELLAPLDERLRLLQVAGVDRDERDHARQGDLLVGEADRSDPRCHLLADGDRQLRRDVASQPGGEGHDSCVLSGEAGGQFVDLGRQAELLGAAQIEEHAAAQVDGLGQDRLSARPIAGVERAQGIVPAALAAELDGRLDLDQQLGQRFARSGQFGQAGHDRRDPVPAPGPELGLVEPPEGDTLGLAVTAQAGQLRGVLEGSDGRRLRAAEGQDRPQQRRLDFEVGAGRKAIGQEAQIAQRCPGERLHHSGSDGAPLTIEILGGRRGGKGLSEVTALEAGARPPA